MSYKKDQNDATVITKLNKKTLSEIADEANGRYVDGKNTSDVIETVGEILNKMDKKNLKPKNLQNLKINFSGFGIRTFLLILDVLFLERKTALAKTPELIQ